MANAYDLKIEIDLPVYNEQFYLKKSINKLIYFLETSNFPYAYKIVIVDNASNDNTPVIARELKARYLMVDYLRINERGRGRALRTAWTKSHADIVSYMDVDLSADIMAFPDLIKHIVNDQYDIVTGSRILEKSKVQRSLKRELISRGYIFCLKKFLRVSFGDPQCGFKALNRKVIDNILPQVLDQAWFFDSELLFKCQKANYKIKEIPITWIEDKNSKVKIIPTIINYLSSLKRLRKEFKQTRNGY